jgi:hypothetical protein
MRKGGWILLGVVVPGILMVMGHFIHAQQISGKDCFFLSSLHHTAEGMRYWYDKENGGFESVSGVPYDDLVCKHCHTASCDVCHKKETDGGLLYSMESARDQDMCLKCHSREKKMLGIDRERDELDVHFAKGMVCTDCHTAKEVHGGGVAYSSMKQAGAMEVECQSCHAGVSSSAAHTVHGEKLDCAACHTRRVVTCYNCHFDAQVKEGKNICLPTTDWVFLINYDGKVTSGNFQSLEYQGKTFVTYAPQFSHSIMKEGRECNQCHGTKIAKRLAKKRQKLTWFDKGKLQSEKGVIPVADGRLDLVFLDRKDGEWIPINNAPPPVVQYSGYGTPLSDEQLKKLAQQMDK